MSGFTEARELLRDVDRDRYVAALLAPVAKHDALIALAAFDAELARIPRLARQQIAGEIRLQWWREAVDGSNAHEAQANPVAAALTATVAAHDLPRALLVAMIDARGHELLPEPFVDTDALMSWCDGVWVSQLRCACRILDPARAGEADDAAGQAGRVLGVMQLLMSFAARAARGQSVIPAALLTKHRASAANVTAGQPHAGVTAALAEMRGLVEGRLPAAAKLWRDAPASLRPAFVLLSLVAPRLAWLARHGTYESGDVLQLRRMWRMWRRA